MNADESSSTIVAIILSAGAGRRFRDPSDTGVDSSSGHKLTAELRGRPVVTWAIEAALSARDAGALAAVYVVTGATEIPIPGDAIEVVNNRWNEGQATSLQAGIAAARAAGAGAAVVGLGDQPFVPASAWQAVATTPGTIVVAHYGGRRGNPVKLDRSVWPLLPTDGDAGARDLICQHPELVTQVSCAGSGADIDTQEDLRTWNSSTNSP